MLLFIAWIAPLLAAPLQAAPPAVECQARLTLPSGEGVTVAGWAPTAEGAADEAAQDAWLLAELHQHSHLWSWVLFDDPAEGAALRQRFEDADGVAPVPGYAVVEGSCRLLDVPPGDAWQVSWGGAVSSANQPAAVLSLGRRRACVGAWRDGAAALYDALPGLSEDQRLPRSQQGWATLGSELLGCFTRPTPPLVAAPQGAPVRVEGEGPVTTCIAALQGQPPVAGVGVAAEPAISAERAWRSVLITASRQAVLRGLRATTQEPGPRQSLGASAWAQLLDLQPADRAMEQARTACRGNTLPESLTLAMPLGAGPGVSCQIYGTTDAPGQAEALSQGAALYCAAGQGRHLEALRAGGAVDVNDSIGTWSESLVCRTICEQSALSWGIGRALGMTR